MTVTITDDFDLHKIAFSGQCFRCREAEGKYRFITGKNVVYLQKRGQTAYDVSCSPEEWERVWIPYFDLRRDYRSIRESSQADTFLARASESGQGIRILRQDAWETLISFIISQRKSIPAIKKSIEALARSYGECLHTDYEELYTFPTAEALSVADAGGLSACGLGYRVPYVMDAASRIHNDAALLDFWSSLDDNGLRSSLKTILGVGDKVANCVMLFAYGRTSSVPIDTWISRVITDEYGGADPFLGYGDNAGIMQQYAFYYMQERKNVV